ncbi:MAG: hypothetical protein AAFS13_09355 [Pseudomonadota bacterium]
MPKLHYRPNASMAEARDNSITVRRAYGGITTLPMETTAATVSPE